MIDRIVNTADDPVDVQEVELEVTLRPKDFANYIGQERLKQNLQLAIDAAQKRGDPIDHVLLYGPPGADAENIVTRGGVNTSDEAVQALLALGYSEVDAQMALQSIDTELSTEERIKLALKHAK